MRVLFLTTHLNYGGVASYILNLTKGLNLKGIKVFVASGGGMLERKLASFGIKHVRLPILTKSELNPKLFIAISKLINFINKENMQILHANTRVSQVVGWISKKFTDIHMITTAHGFYVPRLGRRMLPCWGEKIIAVSKAVKVHLIEDFNLNDYGIKVIRNGIDTARFHPSVKSIYSSQIRSRFGIKTGPVVGTISRLSDIKGLSILLLAVKKLKTFYQDITCLLVGAGREYYKIKNLLKKLNIEENVKLIPPLWEIEEMLSVMDVFICPSLQEGLGLSLIEAMGCQVPVIATKVGGIVEVVRDRYNGILISGGDIDGLVENVRILLEDKNLSKKISNQARVSVCNKFNIDKMVDSTIKVYSEVL